MLRDMEEWCEIRMRVLRDGVSIRQVCEETGHHFDTIKKMLDHPEPPAFQCPERPKPKLGPYLEYIAGVVASDKDMPKKQRHTAKRIFELIREQGYEGGITQVKEAVRATFLDRRFYQKKPWLKRIGKRRKTLYRTTIILK